MEIEIIKKIRLNESEIKEALRKHLIDILGTEVKIDASDISIYDCGIDGVEAIFTSKEIDQIKP